MLAMGRFLLLGRQRGGANFCHVPIHVPLHISYWHAAQNRRHLPINFLPHIRSRLRALRSANGREHGGTSRGARDLRSHTVPSEREMRLCSWLLELRRLSMDRMPGRSGCGELRARASARQRGCRKRPSVWLEEKSTEQDNARRRVSGDVPRWTIRADRAIAG